MKSIALMFMAFFLGVTAGLDLYHWTIAPQDREVDRALPQWLSTTPSAYCVKYVDASRRKARCHV